jgi:hypothetical protein
MSMANQINREVLRYAVIRHMFCQATGKLLDVKDAVLITGKDEKFAGILGGAAWDEIAETVIATLDAGGDEYEVLDGRVLFA